MSSELYLDVCYDLGGAIWWMLTK